jgi:D-sedoheptulose 7-phosphate isomerase
MAMLEQRIQQHFFDSADLQYQAADALARPIADAAQAVLGCITGGSRLLVYGAGASHGLAGYLAEAMIGRFERERPGLAAIELRPSPSIPVGTQVQAIGTPGDVLALLASDASDRSLAEAVQEAHAKEMSVVALVGRSAGAFADTLSETDVLVLVPHDRPARVREMHLLIVHCLCDAVDLQLLGEEHSA